MHSDESITLDGVLNEAIWQRARPLTPCNNSLDGSPIKGPHLRAMFAYGDDGLYLAAKVSDTFLTSRFKEHDEHLWEDDVLEWMVDPLGQGTHYHELQISPAGIIFDSHFDSPRAPPPFGHLAWSSEIRVGIKTFGLVNDARGDLGYQVELVFPWERLILGQTAKSARQQFMQKGLRANLYVLDKGRPGSIPGSINNTDAIQKACAWSPTLVPDFHFPQRFGYIQADPSSRP